MFGKKTSGLEIGLDIGSDKIKLVCLDKDQDTYRLLNHGYYHRDDIDKVKEMFENPDYQSARIRVNIEDASLKIRKVKLPQAPENEIPEMIKWSLKDEIEIEVDDYLFRYQTLPGNENDSEVGYLAFAVTKEAVDKQIEFLKTLNISQPEVMEPNAGALLNLFIHHCPSNERSAMVDIGSSTVFFTVMESDRLFFSRPIGVLSGDVLTKQLARNLNVDDETAKQIKTSYRATDDPTPQEKKIKNTYLHFFSRGALEIQRSLDAYLMQSDDKPIKKIYFTGGGAHLDSLPEKISETLNLPTEVLNPFKNIDTSLIQQDNPLGESTSSYCVACGLAME